MSSPFVGQIQQVPYTFAPTGWALCTGQLLPISQNTALFSLLGTMYGGDGKSTFALPNLQGNMAIHTDQYVGFGQFNLGQAGGEQTVTLLQSEMPTHTHTVSVTASVGHLSSPGVVGQAGANVLSSLARGKPGAYGAVASQVPMNGAGTAIAGGSQPHNNMMPYLTLNYIIALVGVYPPRT